jgi:hypothetical protein
MKSVTGTISTLASDDVTAGLTAGETVKTEINGSTLTGYRTAVQIIQVTDTAITGNLRTGISGRANGANRVRWDTFEAADLAVAGGDGTDFPWGVFRTAPVQIPTGVVGY